MYFFDSIINAFKQTFTDLQAVGLAQKKSWTIAKNVLLFFKCSWLFPDRSVLIFLWFSSSLLIVLFLTLL